MATNGPLDREDRMTTLHIGPQWRRRRQGDEALITPSSGMTRLPMLGVLLICFSPPAVILSTTSPAMDTGRCFLRLFRFASASGSALCCQQVTWPGVFIVRPSPKEKYTKNLFSYNSFLNLSFSFHMQAGAVTRVS